MRRLRRRFMRATAAIVALGMLPVLTSASRVGEADVKAALVFNILLFVSWHTPERPVLRLGVVEDTPTSNALRALEGQSIGKTKLSVVENPSLDEMPDCQAIFVGGNNPSTLYRVATTTLGAKALLIGEGPLAIENGAMIGLVLSGDRYVMDVNLAALRREGLSVSSKLLRLARRVME